MENEVFVDVLGYEGLYQVSNQGRVYSLKSGKFLKPQKDKYGYLYVNLYKDKKMKHYLTHRLVASAFIENPLQLTDVNHISEDKTDNRVENLEWMSHKDNINYGTAIERRVEKRSKPIIQLTKDGKIVNEFPSLVEASRQTRINLGNISQCCRGNKKYSHAGNFLWKYKEGA